MKMKHVLIAIVFLLIADTLNNRLNMNYALLSTIKDIIGILLAVCIITLICLTTRNIVRAIKGAVKKPKES